MKYKQKGFSLVEVMMAIVLSSFALGVLLKQVAQLTSITQQTVAFAQKAMNIESLCWNTEEDQKIKPVYITEKFSFNNNEKNQTFTLSNNNALKKIIYNNTPIALLFIPKEDKKEEKT